MSNVYDMHAKSLEIGDEVDIPCRVIAIHEFEDIVQAQVTLKTRHARAGTKNEYTTFNVDSRQVSRTSRPNQWDDTDPKLCEKCQRHPSACVCTA